jgi:hypothetical protein
MTVTDAAGMDAGDLARLVAKFAHRLSASGYAELSGARV